MSAFSIWNQGLFLAICSLCILLIAGNLSSAQTGPADPVGTRNTLFVVYSGNKLVTFQEYTGYILVIYIFKGIYMAYTWYIPGI